RLGGGDASAGGRGPLAAEGRPPAALDFAARWEAARGVLSVRRYALDAPPGVKLDGEARVEPVTGGRRLAATAAGTVDGDRLDGRAAYDLATGALEATVAATPFDARKVWARLGLPAPPTQATARALRATLRGALPPGGGVGTVEVEATAASLVVASAAKAPLDAALTARLAVRRGAGRPELARIESATIRLSRNARAVAVATAASRTPAALWPVAVEASAADLAAVGPLLAADVTLAGSARLVAEVRGLGPIALRGTFETT